MLVEGQSMLFELKNIQYTYLRDTPFAQEALRGLSLTLPQNQTIALIGPSKAGKSTLLDLLAGLIKPAAGSLLFEGDDVTTTKFDMERLRSKVGVIFQSPETQIFEETVGKDVAFGPQRKKIALAESRRLVQQSLEAVGLPYEDFRTRYTYALSGGQKRRVAIAGVLAMRPEIILFDEPCAGLDPAGKRDLLALIRELKQQGLTLIYASSSLEDIVEIADLIYILDEGRVVKSGSPREILRQADQMIELDITLPEATSIALALRESFPELRSDLLHLDELEAEIMRYSSPAEAEQL
jgi:energy-coupling factor transport system ATP-binding protein